MNEVRAQEKVEGGGCGGGEVPAVLGRGGGRPARAAVRLSRLRQASPQALSREMWRSQMDLSLSFVEAKRGRWGRGGWLLTC